MEENYVVHEIALNSFYIYENPETRSDEDRIKEMESITNVEEPLDLPEWEVFSEPDHNGEAQCRVDTETRIHVVAPRDMGAFQLLFNYLSFEGQYDPSMSSHMEEDVENYSKEIHLDYREIEN